MTTVAGHSLNTASWFDLMTPDPEKARVFYANLFGWTYDVTPVYSIAQAGGRDAGGIGQRPPDAAFPSVWTCYFNVADADATAKAITAAGGKLMMPPMDVMDQGRMAIAIDPTGAAFGLWQPKARLGAQVVSEHGAMGWQECHTHDGAAAQAFYARVFGMEIAKVEGMEYWLLMRGATHLGGVYTDAKMPPHWLVYFDVDDTDACLAKVAATGGRVAMAAHDTPHGRMAVVTDPWNAVFAVIQPPKQ